MPATADCDNCQESEEKLEDEVDILMSSDVMAAQMSTKSITFSRAQSGWLFREDKTVRTTSGNISFFQGPTGKISTQIKRYF